MRNFYFERSQTPGGLTRRHWLKVGAISLGGWTLPELLRRRAEARPGEPMPRQKSVIFVYLAGGPSQLETYDPKPAAPIEIRGPFDVVATRTPGVHFSELMSEQAAVSDKLAIIRSVYHNFEASTNHRAASHLVHTGYPIAPSGRDDEEPRNPSCGSITAKVAGGRTREVPPYVLLARDSSDSHRYTGGAFLGKAFDPFIIDADPNDPEFEILNLTLPRGVDLQRVSGRRGLLESLDLARRTWDRESAANADSFQQQAFDIVHGSAARAAFDLDRESEQMRDRYGRNRTGQSFLLARRLVEAGVPFVEVMPRGGSGSGWDDHDGIVEPMRKAGPTYDRGIAALISDLHERGLNEDVLVVALGEFGRAPRINAKRTGRDHWPNVFSVLIAGGGLAMGQIVGASSAFAEMPTAAPYQPQNILAMVYRHLGIDAAKTFPDHLGRPRYVLEERELIRELL